ncbi:MAG TPA: ATP-binding protein [Candidatus Polarisedimenticolaceae bacterium]
MALKLRGRSLQRSVSLSTGLLVVILMVLTLVVVRYRVGVSLRRNLEARGEAIARSIGAVATPSLLAYNYPALQFAAEGAAGNPGVAYVVIHDKEGMRAGAAGAVPEQLDGERVRLLPGSSAGRVKGSDGRPIDALEVAVPVEVEGVTEPWGLVRVGLELDAAAADLRVLTWQLFGLGALLTLLAVGMGLWLARRIAAPLQRLALGTEALSAGEMDHRIPVEGAKELRELAQSYNRMMERLQEKAKESLDFQAALEVLNATLEQQVRDRTRALEESTAQYKSLVDNSPDSILIVQDGRVRFVNGAFGETFGVEAGMTPGSGYDLSRFFEPSSAALAAGRVAAWERGEEPGAIEVLGRDRSQTIRHMELRGSRIEYRGTPAAECLLVDRTEAKRLHDKLSETEKLRALGELSGGVAHDFNNLLGAVLGRVQLLRRRGFPRDVDFELGIIEKAALDGRETVRRIQEFSRTRRDKRFEPVDLVEVLRDALEITKTRWRNDAMSRSVTIEASLEAEAVPPILGNASELREVVTNLILNAVDAMPHGGRIRLSCRRQDDRVVARCEDTGIGMTEQIRQQLFDPFFTTKGTRGVGLGLSVVYGIVTRHEGKIDVVTAPGKGTTFVLDFPTTREVPKPIGGDGASMPLMLRQGKILVIDDEEEIADVVKDVLVSAGHEVDVALSGADGVRRASLDAYDLVFTDLGMPDMSGWEVAASIGRAKPGLPVALVTGWGSSLDEEEARRKGVVAVVHKPFEIDELIRTAARLLGV